MRVFRCVFAGAALERLLTSRGYVVRRGSKLSVARRRLRSAGLAVALAAGLTVGTSSTALGASFTWSGAARASDPGSPFWSDGANWVGGVAPSGSVGTLSFPRLTSGGCTANPQVDTCYLSVNDLAGLSVNAVSIDDSDGYVFSGGLDGIALGSGGITATPAKSCVCGLTSLFLPITLTAPQTWSIDGGGGGTNVGGFGFGLIVGGNVSGATEALHISLSREGGLSLGARQDGGSGADVEVGQITIVGANTAGGPLANGAVEISNPKARVAFNGTDGNPIRLSNASIDSSNATVGPLMLTGGLLQVGAQPTPHETLTVDGGVTLDSRSEAIFYFLHAGTSAGTDYSQLSASGTVDLGGAFLGLSVTGPNGYGPNQPCPTLRTGDVDTLITTTGSLVGKFAGIPNGATIPLGCASRNPPRVRISYTAQSVTGTVLAAGAGNRLPARPKITRTQISSKHHEASFRFKAIGAASGFQCALLKRKKRPQPRPSFSSCHPPKTYKHLSPGMYAFEVRAVNAARHGKPATKTFTIS